MSRVIVWLSVAALVGCNVSTPLLPGGMIGGTWGGQTAALMADDTSAHIHISCTYGNVHQPIIPDADNRFIVTGEYNVRAYPVDLGVFHPATFYGSISGRKMLLSVVLTDTAVTLGPVTVVYGQEPGIVNCPICRTPAERARRMGKR